MEIDPEILSACRLGDRKSQFQLYKLMYPELMGVCRRYKTTKHDAETVLNEAFYKILTKIDLYSGEMPFQVWCRRITINTIIDTHRREAREMAQIPTENIDNQSVSAIFDYNEAQKRFDADQLLAMIQSLPQATRDVFNLFAIDGYSHLEIAKLYGITEGTSRWHVSSARNQLQVKLASAINTPFTRAKNG